MNYAHFKSFRMNDLSSAKIILEELMDLQGIDRYDLAECKLIYADVMLLSNNIWTALLYYSQVEKEFSENIIGHEAKFRKAKISYYQGDFSWAQTQLDVLKASTSKLIANDAMDLSLIITDNLNLDTSEMPMSLYAKSDLLFYQNNLNESLLFLDSILIEYKSHSLTDEIYFRKYEIFRKMGKIDLAISMLEKIVNEFSYDILYDDALFNLAQIYESHKNDVERSIVIYETILLECSGSIYVSEARKKYRNLRGDNL